MDYHFDSKEDIKLIILTVIKDFKIPVPNALIVDTVLSHSFAEYFDIQQYLYELTDAEMVTYYIEDSVRYYSLTEKGSDAVKYFDSRIPITVREKLFSTARLKAKELKDALSIKSSWKKENDMEYSVELKIVESGYDLFCLNLSIGSEELAKSIAARFEKDPEGLYSKVFSLLIDEEKQFS